MNETTPSRGDMEYTLSPLWILFDGYCRKTLGISADEYVERLGVKDEPEEETGTSDAE